MIWRKFQVKAYFIYMHYNSIKDLQIQANYAQVVICIKNSCINICSA